MEIYNALQLKAGAKVKRHTWNGLTRPLQFLSSKEKEDLNWSSEVIDYYEAEGIKQIRKQARRLLKNYKLAQGIIDKTDYIPEESDCPDIVEYLTKDDSSDGAYDLKFYPIIPNVINVLTGEFSKRNTKIIFRAVDDISFNEQLEEKRKMIEEVLLVKAYNKIMSKLVEMGADLSSEEAQQYLSEENLKTLPEIEHFFRKKYTSIVEQWATHQYNVDVERFRMNELEAVAFRDSLITDREFWHFKMLEDDYDIEVWNPVFTFFHKSPEVRYISQGDYVGKIDLMSVSDVIDNYGWMMTQEQLESLEMIHPSKRFKYILPGVQNDGGFYDPSRSDAWNTEFPSLGMRQFKTALEFSSLGDFDIDAIISGEQDLFDSSREDLLRVTTVYWKTQRKVGYLTKITEDGEMIQDIVSEDYKITDKPIYNTTIYKDKTAGNLVFGEHIDWIWVNEVWGGIKIGPNRLSHRGDKGDFFDAIYLGPNGGKPGRLKFQFKGDNSLYGCKLPVEGTVFSDRNTRSTSLVDMMKPFQIGYNLVNNQIADILVDELGTIILLDQNTLPRHSLGEDWGKGNFQKAWMVMKNFQMLPLDTSIANTENALNFQHFQVLNLEQTNRLLGRISLANYFKYQAFEVVGITPQRLGQEISRETAKGIEQSVNASYAQTEHYFTRHSDYLMPRVHQMRTDLAQYYHSTNPSVRLRYSTTLDEKINFEINGTDLLLRDINVFCTTTTNIRELISQLKALALNNNTTGASLYDLGNVLKSDSLSEIQEIIKSAEEKQQQQLEADRNHQKEILEMQAEAERIKRQEEQAFESQENDKERQKDILVAQISAGRFAANSDLDQNNKNDYFDLLDRIESTNQFKEQMNFKKEQEINKINLAQQQMQLKREELQTRKEISDKQLQIAKENKNRYDVKGGDKDKSK